MIISLKQIFEKQRNRKTERNKIEKQDLYAKHSKDGRTLIDISVKTGEGVHR